MSTQKVTFSSFIIGYDLYNHWNLRILQPLITFHLVSLELFPHVSKGA